MGAGSEAIEIATGQRVVKPAISLADLSEDQLIAFNSILQWFTERPWEQDKSKRVLSLGGYAGTGKTTLLALILDHLSRERRKAVAVLTPTGKASVVLQRKLEHLKSGPVFLGTIHSFMLIPVVDHNERLVGWGRRYFERIGEGENATFVPKNGDKSKIPRVDLIVVDESSMLNRELEKDIEAFQVPVLAVGDHGQLPPVAGHNTWMKNPVLRLERIHRQAEDNPILALATYVREYGNLPRDRGAMESIGIPYYKSLSAAAGDVLETHRTRGIENTALITYTNGMRCKLNEDIHKQRHGSLEPVKGTQVICLKNNKDDMLINGMRGIITSDLVPKGQKDFQLQGRVDFEGDDYYVGPFVRKQFGRPRVYQDTDEASKELGFAVDSMKNLGAFFDYGYVLTCHKAQGSEFSDVFVVLEGARTKEYAKWLYTAVTRASQRLRFIENYWG